MPVRLGLELLADILIPGREHHAIILEPFLMPRPVHHLMEDRGLPDDPAVAALICVSYLSVDEYDVSPDESPVGPPDLGAVDLYQRTPAPCACFDGPGFAPTIFDEGLPSSRDFGLEDRGIHPVDQVSAAERESLSMPARRSRGTGVASIGLIESHAIFLLRSGNLSAWGRTMKRSTSYPPARDPIRGQPTICPATLRRRMLRSSLYGRMPPPV